MRVVIDPLDGSLNAKRGMTHYALSIAVADGPTMADVVFGYVYDFGPREEWYARRGEGAWLNGRRIDPPPASAATSDGRLEIVTFESADPRCWRRRSTALGEHVQPRAGDRLDRDLAVPARADARRRDVHAVAHARRRRRRRAADRARGRRRSSRSPRFDDPLGAPLDIEPHSRVVAARTPEALAQLRSIVA